MELKLYWIGLYCTVTVLYSIVLHCIELHWSALYCIVLYCIVLYSIVIVLYCIAIVLYCIVLYSIVLYCYCTILYCYCIVLYWIGLHGIVTHRLFAPLQRIHGFTVSASLHVGLGVYRGDHAARLAHLPVQAGLAGDDLVLGQRLVGPHLRQLLLQHHHLLQCLVLGRHCHTASPSASGNISFITCK